MMNSTSTAFSTRVEDFLARTGIKTSEFGVQAVGDRTFVLNLRRGRSPTLRTADRVLAFIERFEAEERERDRRKTNVS